MRLALACTALGATLAFAPYAPYALSQETAAPTEQAVVVRFPDLEAARAAMTDDAVEPYIATLQRSFSAIFACSSGSTPRSLVSRTGQRSWSLRPWTDCRR